MNATHTGKPNRKPGSCRDCGRPLAPDSGLLVAISYYDWDNPNEDVQGSILMTRYEVECVNRTECAARVVADSTNAAALRRVANDRENLGELADRAHQILREISDLSHQIAHGNDLAASEGGWGVIGGPRH